MNARRDPPATLGAQLRKARDYVGFSEEEVARYLGLPRQELCSIERGSRQAGDLELRRLAGLYQTTVEALTDPDHAEPGWESFPALDQASANLPATDRDEILRFARFLQSKSGEQS